MFIWFSFIFFLSFFIVLFAVPFCIRLAHKTGIVDIPNERKMHKDPVPLLGGLAIFAGISLAGLVGFYHHSIPLSEKIIGIWIGSFVIMLLGLYDDIKGTGAYGKIFFQTVAGSIVYFFGVRLNIIAVPGLGGWDTGVLSYPLTILWILALTNALNLLDGLDGLASGVVFIASGFMTYFLFHTHLYSAAIILTATWGATGAFLKYNFPPARIFMGDTGSLLLGFGMSTVSLLALNKGPFAITVMIPIVILSVPILDTIMAILRRAKNREGIFSADKKHLHHRLLELSGSFRKTLFIIYAVSIALGGVAYLSLFYFQEHRLVLFAATYFFLVMLLFLLIKVEKNQ